MEATRSRPGTALPVATLVLAGAAGALLHVSDAVWTGGDGAEPVVVLTALLGWVLAFWAVVLGGLGTVALVHRLLAGRGAGWPGVILLAAGVGLVVAVLGTHAPVGSGAGWG